MGSQKGYYKFPLGAVLLLISVVFGDILYIIRSIEYYKPGFSTILHIICVIALAVVVLMKNRGFLVLATTGLVGLFELISFFSLLKHGSAVDVLLGAFELLTLGFIALLALEDIGIRILPREKVKIGLTIFGGASIVFWALNMRTYMGSLSSVFRYNWPILLYYIGILLIGLWVANPYKTTRQS